jgi:hypothetical protein
MKECAINLSMLLAFVVLVPTALLWSLWTGRTISRVAIVDRATQPVGFWFCFSIWAVFGALCFYGGIASLLHGGVCPATWGNDIRHRRASMQKTDKPKGLSLGLRYLAPGPWT